jgi:hypothetical protein
MEIVRIQALAREGFPTRPRAGRVWPSGEAVAVEIVDAEEDPTIEIETVDAAGKKYMQKRPDPARMSRKIYETMIVTDPVLRTMSDGDTSSELSQAALETVRKSASDSAGKLVMAEAKVATLTEQLTKAKARITDLEAQLGIGNTGKVDEEVSPEASAPSHSSHSSPPKASRR